MAISIRGQSTSQFWDERKENFIRRLHKGKFIISMGVLDQGYKESGNWVEYPRDLTVSKNWEKKKSGIQGAEFQRICELSEDVAGP